MTSVIDNAIVLTALRDDDAALLHGWRSDPEVREGALGYPFPTTVDAEREWLRSFIPRGTPSDLCLAVREANEGPLLGYCQLRGIDWIARCAEFGIVIGTGEARGRGIGRQALQATIQYARSELGLRRLWLRVVEYNQAAIHLYHAAGFAMEGRLIRHVYRRGELHDVLILGQEFDENTQAPSPK